MNDAQEGLSHITQLFIKHGEGRTTPAEEAEILAYLAKGDATALPDVEQWKQETGEIVMEETTSQKMLQHILATNPSTAPVRKMQVFRWLAAAAIIGIIATFAWLWHTPTSPAVWASVRTGYGELRKVTLADGSVITLNANTELRYDSTAINSANREVWLKGEAFFQVKTAAAGSFKVHAGDSLSVSVLGTEFNVRHTNTNTAVTLNSGKVKVAAVQQGTIAEIVLRPGEMVMYDAAQQQLQRQTADTALASGWKSGQQSFFQASLQEVTAWMTTHFGVAVSFSDPRLKQLPFSGTIPADSVAHIIPILEKSLDIRIDKSGRQMMIRPAH